MGIATYTPAVLENPELLTQEAFSYRHSVELQHHAKREAIDAIGNKRDDLIVKLMLQGAKRIS